MSTIDAIVISEARSLVALPFYTEESGFRGKVRWGSGSSREEIRASQYQNLTELNVFLLCL